jgi:hypothetical protein
MECTQTNHERRKLNVRELADKSVAEHVEFIYVVKWGHAVGSIQHLLGGGGGLAPLSSLMYVQRHRVLMQKGSDERGGTTGIDAPKQIESSRDAGEIKWKWKIERREMSRTRAILEYIVQLSTPATLVVRLDSLQQLATPCRLATAAAPAHHESRG